MDHLNEVNFKIIVELAEHDYLQGAMSDDQEIFENIDLIVMELSLLSKTFAHFIDEEFDQAIAELNNYKSIGRKIQRAIHDELIPQGNSAYNTWLYQSL